MNVEKIYKYTKFKFLNNITSEVEISNTNEYESLNDIDLWIKNTNKSNLWVISSYNELKNIVKQMKEIMKEMYQLIN